MMIPPVCKFHDITPKTFGKILILKLRIDSCLDSDAVEKFAPQFLVFQFLRRKPFELFPVEIFRSSDKKSFALGVQCGELASLVIDHKMIVGQTVLEMFPQERKNVIFGMNLGKQHAIFGESHIEEIAAAHKLPVLARLPIDPSLAKACDAGQVESLSPNYLEDVAKNL